MRVHTARENWVVGPVARSAEERSRRLRCCARLEDSGKRAGIEPVVDCVLLTALTQPVAQVTRTPSSLIGPKPTTSAALD
eukprot:2115174-Pyramimonas_sp.AAC.1